MFLKVTFFSDFLAFLLTFNKKQKQIKAEIPNNLENPILPNPDTPNSLYPNLNLSSARHGGGGVKKQNIVFHFGRE